MEPRQKIKILHGLVFPLDKFDNNYVKACKKIKAAIREICLKQQKELRIPILMIGRFLEVDIDDLKHSFSLDLCKIIQEKILDICLSLEEYEKNMIVMEEMGVPSEVGKNNRLICDSYSEKIAFYPNFLMELYYPGRLNYKSPYDDDKKIDGLLIDKIIKRIYGDYKNRSWKETVLLSEKFENFKNIIDKIVVKEEISKEDKNFFLDIINFETTTKKIEKAYKEHRFENDPMTEQEKNFLVILHNNFRTGKIPLNAEDICSYF